MPKSFPTARNLTVMSKASHGLLKNFLNMAKVFQRFRHFADFAENFFGQLHKFFLRPFLGVFESHENFRGTDPYDAAGRTRVVVYLIDSRRRWRNRRIFSFIASNPGDFPFCGEPLGYSHTYYPPKERIRLLCFPLWKHKQRHDCPS